MKRLYIALLLMPLAGNASEMCEKVNASKLDVTRYGYDKQRFELFESTVQSFVAFMSAAQGSGMDGQEAGTGKLYEDELEYLRKELDALADADMNREYPSEHVAFMRLMNEFVLKYSALQLLYEDDMEVAEKYRTIMTKAIEYYAKKHQQKLKSASCSINESILALESLKTLKTTLDNFSAAGSESGYALYKSFRETTEDYINQCPVKGVVKAKFPISEVMCASSGSQYIVPKPYFYSWDLSDKAQTEYSAVVRCNDVGDGARMDTHTFTRNQSAARLELDDEYKLTLKHTLKFSQDADVYTFICKGSRLPNGDMSKAELAGFAKKLSRKNSGCVVLAMSQDEQGGDLTVTSESKRAAEFKAVPGAPAQPSIAFNPPDGVKPVYEGEIGMNAVNPDVIINWKCTQPYEYRVTTPGGNSSATVPSMDLSGARLTIEFTE